MNLLNKIDKLHKKQRDYLVPTGISYLDDALGGGVGPNDMMILAGETGFGKTELCSQIAIQGGKDKRVTMLALEAEPQEIEQRLIYKYAAEAFFLDIKRPHVPVDISYLNFYRGKLDGTPFIKYTMEAIEQVEKQLEKVKVLYPREMDAEGFVDVLQEDCSDSDLVICDHIHYFEWNNDSEMEGIRKAIKLIRDRTLFLAKPVILVSHLRKADRFKKSFPDLHELHGSSELSKRATSVVLIGFPKPGKFNFFENCNPTIFNIAKHRHDGSSKRLYALMHFDYRRRKYLDNYALLELKKDEFELLPSERVPKWAKRFVAVPRNKEIKL